MVFLVFLRVLIFCDMLWNLESVLGGCWAVISFVINLDCTLSGSHLVNQSSSKALVSLGPSL